MDSRRHFIFSFVTNWTTVQGHWQSHNVKEVISQKWCLYLIPAQLSCSSTEVNHLMHNSIEHEQWVGTVPRCAYSLRPHSCVTPQLASPTVQMLINYRLQEETNGRRAHTSLPSHSRTLIWTILFPRDRALKSRLDQDLFTSLLYRPVAITCCTTSCHLYQ